MMTGGYELTLVATEWVNMLQYAQVALRHGAHFAGMGLAAIAVSAGWQRLRCTLAGRG